MDVIYQLLPRDHVCYYDAATDTLTASLRDFDTDTDLLVEKWKPWRDRILLGTRLAIEPVWDMEKSGWVEREIGETVGLQMQEASTRPEMSLDEALSLFMLKGGPINILRQGHRRLLERVRSTRLRTK